MIATAGTSVLTAFGAGALASLSPCVYPLMPITLGFFGTRVGAQKKVSILVYAFGQMTAFVGLGVFTVFAGETLGFSSESRGVNLSIGIFLLLTSAVAFYGRLPAWVSRIDIVSKFRRSGATSSLPGSQSSPSSQDTGFGILGALLLGAGSALVASPCTSPILAGVLATMANSVTFSSGLVLMSVYALGFSALFLAVGLGLLNLRKLPKAGKWMVWVHRLSTVLLLFAGIFYIFRGAGFIST